MNFLIKILLPVFAICFSCSADNSKDNENQSGVVNYSAGEVIILEKWELPSILKEVSGISYMKDGRFACVQDEDGKIFIYNTNTSKIEKEIPFADDGDYEGLTVAENNAYVVRSDGEIYEVANWNSNDPGVSTFSTPLTEDHDVEGLCYDKENNRLLLAIKGEEPGNPAFKGIYAFDFEKKKLKTEPVYKINLNDHFFSNIDEEDKDEIVQPSEINIDPETGNLYITDAKNPKIIVMNPSGKIESVYPLSEEKFPQAEGITFSPDGQLFISNEEDGNDANILKVNIQKP